MKQRKKYLVCNLVQLFVLSVNLRLSRQRQPFETTCNVTQSTQIGINILFNLNILLISLKRKRTPPNDPCSSLLLLISFGSPSRSRFIQCRIHPLRRIISILSIPFAFFPFRFMAFNNLTFLVLCSVSTIKRIRYVYCKHGTIQLLQFSRFVFCNSCMRSGNIEISFNPRELFRLSTESGECIATCFFGFGRNTNGITGRRERLLFCESNFLFDGLDIFVIVLSLLLIFVKTIWFVGRTTIRSAGTAVRIGLWGRRPVAEKGVSVHVDGFIRVASGCSRRTRGGWWRLGLLITS